MNRLSRRLWIAALLMTCGWIGTNYIRSGFTFEIQKMTKEVDSLPKEILGYVGTDIAVDEEIEKVLSADSAVNRIYRRPEGGSFTLHVATWTKPEEISAIAPHHPTLCYANAGWKILEVRHTQMDKKQIDAKQIDAKQIEKHSIGLLLCERNKEYCVVAFWYQMGKHSFSSQSDGRRIHQIYWGKRIWPATIKFMVQVTAKDIDTAIPQIEPIAAKLFDWAANL